MDPLLSNATDESIASKVQGGDSSLFGMLLERYEVKLTRYVRKFIANPEDAQDITQEVFIKAYRNIRSFNTNRKFSSWIYRIAHNEAINFLKKRRVQTIPLLEFDTLFPHTLKDDKLNTAQDFEIKDMVAGSLELIDLKYRAPLSLYYLEGFDYKEISDILRIPVATVGVRLSRGKAMLQKKIKK